MTRRPIGVGVVAWTLAIFTASAVRAQEVKPQVENDVVYAHNGGQDLKLDMARPASGDGPFPAIVVIHGGAWRGGAKQSNRPILARLANLGFVAISPQYRFCPKDTFPAQVIDVKASVRWLREHAKEYKIDAEHIGAMGFSAGGHLSLMLGLTDANDGLEGDVSEKAPSSRVQAVVNYFGPTDLAAADIPADSKPLVGDFIGGLAVDKPEAAKKGSPLTYVTKDDPPILTYDGTKDPLVPHTQALKLSDAQTAAGVPGRVELILGGGHGNWGQPELERTIAETIAFFNTHLKKKAQ
jgi:acetyl esterase/lipase